MVTLKYKDEKDRAFGLGGMVVCMNAMESEKYIDYVSLDGEADHGMEFTPDFFQISNQRLSAKAVWNDRLNHFQLLTGLMVSNLLSRAMFRDREGISRELADLLLTHVAAEGKELCSLEDDEIKELYNKTFTYFHRLFSSPEVGEVVGRFVELIGQRRRMENEEILAVLRPLRRW
ncbi:MAG: hypothetical protein K2K36_10100 [Muribaculaceae bacterium]|nr:hypothetical protein [Muribaculaceae bacterium]